MARRVDASKERYWLELVLRWQKSKLTIREFCQRRRLREPSFYFWRRALHERGLLRNLAEPKAKETLAPPQPVFVNLTLNPEPAAPSAVEIVLGERRLLRVRPGFDPDTLLQLVRLLEESPC